MSETDKIDQNIFTVVESRGGILDKLVRFLSFGEFGVVTITAILNQTEVADRAITLESSPKMPRTQRKLVKDGYTWVDF